MNFDLVQQFQHHLCGNEQLAICDLDGKRVRTNLFYLIVHGFVEVHQTLREQARADGTDAEHILALGVMRICVITRIKRIT